MAANLYPNRNQENMSLNFIRTCRPFSIFLLFLLVFQFSQAQHQAPALDRWLDDHVKGMGGRAVLMIYRDGEIIYNHSVNDLSGRQKMIGRVIARKTGKDEDEILKDFDEHTKIGIASCSKWLSAALVMSYVDEGSIRIDDSIGKFLPVMTKHGKGHITISQCLSHLTGISSKGIKENKEMMRGGTMASVIEEIASMPMEGEPGKTFHYSSAGLQLAAAIVEKVSGTDFRTAFQNKIAIPCGMKQTDFGVSPVPLAAGGARSSASDYLRFVSMILQNGMLEGKRVLSANSVALMQRNYAAHATVKYSPAEAGNWGYGFGAWVMDNADERTRSNAVTSPGLFGSFPWVDNEKKYAAVLLTFNLKNKGRGKKYKELKSLVDSWVQGLRVH